MGQELQEKQKRYRVPGVVKTDEAYALDELRARMRWTPSACRAAKKQGLKLVRVGKRFYATGAAVLEFLEQQGQNAAENN